MTDNPALEEYKICDGLANHLDEQNWMWGSFLFGGSLASIGFVLSQKLSSLRLLGLSLILTGILSGYVLYVWRSMGVQAVCFSRMRQIEATCFKTVGIATTMYRVRNGDPIYSFEGKRMRILPIRQLHILVLMVVALLGILWIGVIFLIIGLPKLP
jgi:hypothetical protein